MVFLRYSLLSGKIFVFVRFVHIYLCGAFQCQITFFPFSDKGCNVKFCFRIIVQQKVIVLMFCNIKLI